MYIELDVWSGCINFKIKSKCLSHRSFPFVQCGLCLRRGLLDHT